MEHILSEGWGLYPEYIQNIQNNVWKAETPNGCFALKQSLLKEKNLRFICRAEQSLPHHGFYRFALLQNCKNGELYFKQGEHYYTLHQWINGEKCDFQNTAHIIKAAATLGDFHLRSRDLSLHPLATARSNCFIRGENMEKHIAELYRFYHKACTAPHKVFHELYREYFPYFIRKAESAIDLLRNSEYPRLAAESAAVGSFIHYDVAARNFIIRNKKAFLIDFDYCCCDIPLTDLMRLTKRSMKRPEEIEEKLNAILNGYQQYRFLTKEECKVLFALILFPQKFWRIAHRFFCEGDKHDEDFCIKKLKLAIEESFHEELWLPLLKEKLEVSY